MHPDNEISKHIEKHGDGVKVLALWVDDAEKSWKETTSRGAISYSEPEIITDESGTVKKLLSILMAIQFILL